MTGSTIDFLPTVPADRKTALCGGMKIANGVGLEFGPLTRPLVRPEEGDIRFVDAMSTEELKEQFKADLTHPADQLVPISYVWQGGELTAQVGDKKFDYALASHVIEHVPDVVGWLNSILAALDDGGLIGLAIPDKRYSFDFHRPTTTTAQLVDAWLRKLSRPSPQQVFDHFSQVTKVQGEELTALHRGEVLPTCNERHHNDAFALAYARKAATEDEYINIHASVFTPASFLQNLYDLTSVGIFNAEVTEVYDTAVGYQEFVCILRKAPAAGLTVQQRRLNHIRSLIARLRPAAYTLVSDAVAHAA